MRDKMLSSSQKSVKCQTCGGKGTVVRRDKKATCHDCRGTGKVGGKSYSTK